jgi:WD40 repeat protein/tRNA A-37 threonylcarbamoyl transferase component Bud32
MSEVTLVLTAAAPRQLEGAMLGCPSEQMILDLLGGRLVLSQAAALHQHFEGCSNCRALLVALGQSGEPDPHGLPFVDPEHYYIDGQLAQGGLGRILKARDQRLGRVVAIKQLLTHDAGLEARFRREALVTARLQHPAIVPVYEAGRWPSGEPFYAMRLVAGRSLREVVAQARTLDERLALVPRVITVADALAYAHEKEVIHRDLKPDNILVGEFGETVVIDWGLAKVGQAAGEGGEPIAALDGLSVDGTVMGTPAYMPPEQARGAELDARADVYALGAVLYHVLCGEPPYRGKSKDVLAQVLEAAPPPVERRAPGAPDPLTAIVARAMARTPAARYPSAGELAEDLRRFVTGQLVRAHRYSRTQLGWRWLKRHQVLAVGLSVLLLSAGLGLWRVLGERNRAQAAQRAAEAARLTAESGRRDLLLLQARTSLDHDPTASAAWLKRYLADGGLPGPVWPLAAELVGKGVAQAVLPDATQLATLSWDGRLAALPAKKGSGVRLWEPETGRMRQLLGARFSSHLQFSPDETRLVSTGMVGVAWWDLRSGAHKSILLEEPTNAIGFSRDHKLALADMIHERFSWLDLDTATISEAALSIRGQSLNDAHGKLVTLRPDGARRVVEPVDSRLQEKVDGGRLQYGTQLSADGGWLLGPASSGLRLSNLATGRAWNLTSGESALAAVGPEGWQAAWVAEDRDRVMVWHRGESYPLARHGAGVCQLAYAPTGRILATASTDGQVRLWSGADLPVRALLGHPSGNVRIGFSGDGRFLETHGERGLRLWRTDDVPRVILGGGDAVKRLELAPDGSFVILGGDRVVSWRAAARYFPAREGAALALSPDGKSVAIGGMDGVQLCAAACKKLDTNGLVVDVVFSSDGRQLAAADAGGARVWDLATLAVRTFAGDDTGSWHATFSPDGKQLAMSGIESKVTVVELATGQRRVFDGHKAPVSELRFSPDGRTLASGSADATVRLWDLASGKSRVLDRLTLAVTRLAFSPDSRMLAVADPGRVVRLWETGSGRVRVLEGHEDAVNDLAFSADGTLLASASADRSVWIWDVAGAHPAQILRGHSGPVNRVRFASDRKTVYSAGEDGTVRSWPLRPARGANQGAALAAFLESLTSAVVDGDGVLATPLGR